MEHGNSYCHKDVAMDGKKPVQQNGGDTQRLYIRCRVEWIPPAQSSAAVAQVVADTLAPLPRTCPFIDIVPATLYYLGYNTNDVIGATVTPIITVHGSLTFLADMYGFFHPSRETVIFSVINKGIRPVDEMVFLSRMVSKDGFIVLCEAGGTLTSGYRDTKAKWSLEPSEKSEFSIEFNQLTEYHIILECTVQIRNWKPVSCDVITDNPSATVDDVLGAQLASLTTLRIRLRSCFRPVPKVTEDVKDKLLTYLFDRLRTTLAATGCPISDALLSEMLRGEISGTDHRLSESTLRAFDQWFSSQVNSAKRTSDSQRPAASDDSDGGGSSPDGQRQTGVDSTDHDLPPWRSSSTVDVVGCVASEDSQGGHNDDEDRSRLSTQDLDNSYVTESTKALPVLPNRNAVYVADAILPPETLEGSCDGHYRNGVGAQTDDNSDGEDDLEVVLPSSSPSPTGEARMEMEFSSDDKEDQVSPEMDTFAQEEATDLSLPKQNGDRRSSHGDARSVDYLSTGGSSGSEGGGSGAQSPMMQAPPHGVVPPHNFLLNPSAAIAAAGLFSPSSATQFPPFYHQRALQLAAMSRAAALGLPFHGKDVASKLGGTRSAHGYVPGAYGSKTGYSQSAAKSSVTTASPGPEPGTGAKRSRVFIDPLTEIPRLERWFADDTHPSSYVIEKYTEELNRSPYRQRFPRLEPKNLQLWFKNHRAKMKRQRDACLAAAAAAAAAASANGTRQEGIKAEHYRPGNHHTGEMGRHVSGNVDAARPFQKVEYQKADGGERTYSNVDGGASFQTSTARSITAEDRSSTFLDSSHLGSGGSALDELVLRLRSGPLGRLPETTTLQPTSASCDQ